MCILLLLLLKLSQLRWLKETEVERDMLSRGIEMAELTRTLYRRKITQLDARRKHFGDSHMPEVLIFDLNCVQIAQY